jgi:hypothetical protein
MGATDPPAGDSDPARRVAQLDQIKARADDAFEVILDDVKARLGQGQDPTLAWHACWSDLTANPHPSDGPGEHTEKISFLAAVAATFALRLVQTDV